MNLRVFFCEHPVLLGSAAFVAGIATSGLKGFLRSGAFKFDNWGVCGAIAVVVALQAQSHPSQ